MITESQLDAFEKKTKSDALKAFNDLLETYKAQKGIVDGLSSKLHELKARIEGYAHMAHYQIDWEKLTATEFQNIGDCMSCKQKNVGRVDYNGHGHWVCEPCDRSLNNEFENEYQ
jgi:hypothetical protein